jgi:hypothetical protein
VIDLIDVVELHAIGDKLLERDLALQILLHQFRDTGEGIKVQDE